MRLTSFRLLQDRLRHALSLPTARAFTVLAAAILLYLFGNQTQVGWMFVMSALLAGAVLAALPLNWRILRGVEIERRVGQTPNAALYEGDTITVALTFRNAARTLAAQVRAVERCPLAALVSARRNLGLFVPALLPHGDGVSLEYQVTLDRRGAYVYPPLDLSSRAPFGFFRRHRRIDLPTPVLVYPEVRPLRRFPLLDRRLALEVARPRAGEGTEIFGIRPYRSGDSPRRIHWRSVARTGRLISKQFVDESRPGLTLLLDVRGYPYPATASKHTPFEWAVKVAASIGDYALRQGYRLHLRADPDAGPPPMGALPRLPFLEYLARVQPTGRHSFEDVLDTSAPSASPCVVALLPWPDRDVLPPLIDLRSRGVAVFVVLIDPASFPAGGPCAAPMADDVRACGLEGALIQFGRDWREQLLSHDRVLALEDYAHVYA